MAREVKMSRLRRSIVFNLHNAPRISSDSSGSIDPFRVEIIRHDNVAAVKVTGYNTHHQHRSIYLNLVGTKYKHSCPEWLGEMIRRAGYEGVITRG